MTLGADGGGVVDRPVAHPSWIDKDAGWIVRLIDHELARDGITRVQRDRLERSLERMRRVLGDFPVTTAAERSSTES